jgi:hypothetical protein
VLDKLGVSRNAVGNSNEELYAIDQTQSLVEQLLVSGNTRIGGELTLKQKKLSAQDATIDNMLLVPHLCSR